MLFLYLFTFSGLVALLCHHFDFFLLRFGALSVGRVVVSRSVAGVHAVLNKVM